MPTDSSTLEKKIKEDIIQPLEQTIEKFHKSLDLPSLRTALKFWLDSYEALINKDREAKKVDQTYKALIQDAQSSLSNTKDKQERSNIRRTLRQKLKNLESEHFAVWQENLFKIGISLLEEAREKLTGQHIDYIVEYSGFSSSNQTTSHSSPVLLSSEDILMQGKSVSTASSKTTFKSIQEGNFQKIFASTSALQIGKSSLFSHNDYLDALFQTQDSEDSFYRRSLAVFLEHKTGQRLAKKNEGRFFEAVLHYANLLKAGEKRPSMKQAISRVDTLPYYSGPDMIFEETVDGQPKYRFLQAKLLGSATISFSATYNGIYRLSELLGDIKINEQELEDFLFWKSNENSKNTVDQIEQKARKIGVAYLKQVLETGHFKN